MLGLEANHGTAASYIKLTYLVCHRGSMPYVLTQSFKASKYWTISMGFNRFCLGIHNECIHCVNDVHCIPNHSSEYSLTIVLIHSRYRTCCYLHTQINLNPNLACVRSWLQLKAIPF